MVGLTIYGMKAAVTVNVNKILNNTILYYTAFW